MADEIRKIANLRTEASAPDLPGRVQNEEFVFDEMIGAELVQEVCRHKDIRSVEPNKSYLLQMSNDYSEGKYDTAFEELAEEGTILS